MYTIESVSDGGPVVLALLDGRGRKVTPLEALQRELEQVCLWALIGPAVGLICFAQGPFVLGPAKAMTTHKKAWCACCLAGTGVLTREVQPGDAKGVSSKQWELGSVHALMSPAADSCFVSAVRVHLA
jgi:hypothetical protein